MSDGETPAAASPKPDPDRAGPDALPRVGFLLGIVRKLVLYGSSLILILQEGVSVRHCAEAKINFGTKDLALIIARIKCGLQRAAMLEVRLNRYVTAGRDLKLLPLRALAARKPRAARPADAPPPAKAPVLALLPSVEEIAEQVRTRSLGAVIGDICRDIGLLPGVMNGVIWEELMEAAIKCGIDLNGLIHASRKPLYGTYQDHVEIAMTAWPGAVPHSVVPVSGRPP